MTVTKTSCQADTLEADPTNRQTRDCDQDIMSGRHSKRQTLQTDRHVTVTKTSCQADTLEADPTNRQTRDCDQDIMSGRHSRGRPYKQTDT